MLRLFVIFICSLTLTGCFAKEDVIRLHGAENMRMTSDGRLFATGSTGLYELTRDRGNITKRQINTQPCQHLGLAEMHGWLFSVCMEKTPGFVLKAPFYTPAKASLWAYSLTTAGFFNVGELTDFYIPNGIDALGQDNAILIADENFMGQGGVSKAIINFDAEIPFIESVQPQWIGANEDVGIANGVRVLNNAVFLTDKGSLKRVPLNTRGEPQTSQTLYSAFTILDDLAPFCDGVLVTDFIGGKLIYVSEDGSRTWTSPSGLVTPSSVLPNAQPLFGNDVILVTELRRFSEKAHQSPWGRLVAVKPNMDHIRCP